MTVRTKPPKFQQITSKRNQQKLLIRCSRGVATGLKTNSGRLPEPASRDDHEQQREQAEAERQPPICARLPARARCSDKTAPSPKN